MLRLVAGRLPHRTCKYCRSYTSRVDNPLSSSIRALMRSSAQPVAVITSLLSPHQQQLASSSSSLYVHGATLSSFSTISLHPPLLAFSIQTPSRMADALQVELKEGEDRDAHFVINILSESQNNDAIGFSTPGLTPFSLDADWTIQLDADKRDNDRDHPLSNSPFHASAFAKDVPVLSNSVGAFACSIVSIFPLTGFENRAEKEAQAAERSGSELFIARVHGVERIPQQDAEGKRPLIYWNQQFTSVKS